MADFLIPELENDPAPPYSASAALEGLESARVDLANQLALYQFHVGSYIRGIAFYLAINAVLFKFALDGPSDRVLFSIIALASAFAILIPLVFGFMHVRLWSKRFEKLATLTKTGMIDFAPFVMLSVATAAYWLIIFVSWSYMLYTGLSYKASFNAM